MCIIPQITVDVRASLLYWEIFLGHDHLVFYSTLDVQFNLSLFIYLEDFKVFNNFV